MKGVSLRRLSGRRWTRQRCSSRRSCCWLLPERAGDVVGSCSPVLRAAPICGAVGVRGRWAARQAVWLCCRLGHLGESGKRALGNPR